jgi:hypothetical protein
MKDAIKTRLDAYKAEMDAASPEEIPEIRAKFSEWYHAQSAGDKASMKPFWDDIKKSARTIIGEIKVMLDELKSLTDTKLVVGKLEYSLDEWITISDYSRRHNLKTSRVQNWITRGVIPPDKVVVVPQLNSIKLIKNEIYRSV